MKISYAITVCNELEEIKELIPHLLKYKKEEDEIVILQDIRNRNTDEKVNQVWEYLHSMYQTQNIIYFRLISEEFQGDFAEWKNSLNSYCMGNFIFQIDADEIPDVFLLENIHTIVEANPEIDLFLIPRINSVEGITQEHIIKWGWKQDIDGRINTPDYQTRIYRNSEDIKWMGHVHEKIVGFKMYSALPDISECSLYHHKNIEKQEKQNNFYNTL